MVLIQFCSKTTEFEHREKQQSYTSVWTKLYQKQHERWFQILDRFPLQFVIYIEIYINELIYYKNSVAKCGLTADYNCQMKKKISFWCCYLK